MRSIVEAEASAPLRPPSNIKGNASTAPTKSPAAAETLHEVGGEHGQENQLAAARAREDRTQQDEAERDHRQSAARQFSTGQLRERKGQRQTDADGERELVRILQDAAVAHASVFDRGRTEKPDVLAQVMGSGLGASEITFTGHYARPAVGFAGGDVAGNGFVDRDARPVRKALMDADRGDQNHQTEQERGNHVQGSKALHAVRDHQIQRDTNGELQRSRRQVAGSAENYRDQAPTRRTVPPAASAASP
jgi:hypothetical protein